MQNSVVAQGLPQAGNSQPEGAEAPASKFIADSLGSTLQGLFEQWKTARLEMDEEWLKALRAYNSLYEADIRATFKPGQSDLFISLTRMKTQAAYSRIVDLLFQSGDESWGIDHTPVPEMKEGTEIVDPDTGAIIALSPEQVAEHCAEKAKKMADEIKDQLVEAEYDTSAKVAILEACIVGSGCLKGVTTATKTRQTWANRNRPLKKNMLGTVLSRLFGKAAPTEDDGGWQTATEKKVVPDVRPVSVFDLFPDPSSTTVEGCSGMFERHVLNRPDFRVLGEEPGFDADAIDEIIFNAPDGNHVDLPFEIELRAFAKNSVTTGPSGRYDVLEYWGMVTGADLVSAGLEGIDENGEYQVNVWFCNGRTIKAIMNPTLPQRLPYNIFPYKRVPHQFWGQGVPIEMRDSQTMINSIGRTLDNNLGISSGPMVEVNTALMADGEDPRDMHAWRIWLRDGGDPQYPMLRFYQPTNITGHLTQVLELFRRFADEETNLPSYTHGEQTPSLNSTAAGMSMLMSASNVVLKASIKNIDDYLTKPLITSAYHWNMKWNKRTDIKGDMQVRARGATVLVAREVQSQRLIQFMQMTANPFDMPLVDRRYLLRTVAESLEIDAKKAVPDAPESQQIPGPPGGGGNPAAGEPPGMGGPEELSGPPPAIGQGQPGNMQPGNAEAGTG